MWVFRGGQALHNSWWVEVLRDKYILVHWDAQVISLGVAAIYHAVLQQEFLFPIQVLAAWMM